ncbi:C40 family peptidase [Crenobacter cavernae]|uniref:Peptidoglycan endopeptidase n=1 Tax=Crenobacter cavernae TaxID=2290923 RepID=A0A345Y7Y1_9NEIS|nr:C40 family peptidase [Crenobacter cavernae]AXK40033.1 peptidoglycan endopeptidase [Crenobacter cavernae]
MKRRAALFAVAAALLAACTTPAKKPTPRPLTRGPVALSGLRADGAGREILIYTLSLLDLEYKFGGANPEAGLDCSGMVAYIYQNAVGVKLPHNAAQIARLGRPVSLEQLQVGDLVFFNTLGRPFSHMGLFIGDDKFVHAPRTNSTIRAEYLSNPYFASRFEGARTLFG